MFGNIQKQVASKAQDTGLQHTVGNKAAEHISNESVKGFVTSSEHQHQAGNIVAQGIQSEQATKFAGKFF